MTENGGMASGKRTAQRTEEHVRDSDGICETAAIGQKLRGERAADMHGCIRGMSDDL